MEKKKSNKISWSTIYSLGLVPAILVWGLAPSLKENVIVLTSIITGIIWTIFSRLYIHFFKGCGIIGWITGWSMIFGGITKAFLLLFGYYNIPIVLFWAPCMVVILYLFEHRNIHPPFCYQCILKRGGIRERHLLGDFSRYETHYIVRLILIGSILVTMLSWILFAFGVERQSRAGNYFYFYFPLGLSIAIIIFEIIRRLLIQQLIESHEKKCKRYINDKTNNPDMDYFFTVIRIMVIGQEKIYLIENKGDEIESIAAKWVRYSYTSLYRLLYDARRRGTKSPANHTRRTSNRKTRFTPHIIGYRRRFLAKGRTLRIIYLGQGSK